MWGTLCRNPASPHRQACIPKGGCTSLAAGWLAVYGEPRMLSTPRPPCQALLGAEHSKPTDSRPCPHTPVLAGPPSFTAGWWVPLFNVSRQVNGRTLLI